MLKFIRKIFSPAVEAKNFICEILDKKYLIYELVKRDFKSKYSGSFLGLVWSFVQPLAMMVIMWFVLTQGLKAGNLNGDIPFVAYMFVAQIAWNYFSETWGASTNVIREYSFLVKKVNFRLSILPIVKIFSGFINHFIFLVFIVIVLLVNGIYPSVYWLQFVYYLFYLVVLCLGLSWMSSAINVFMRDIGYVITILISFGFWLTPIFWNIGMLPESIVKYVRLNPILYVVEGYRNSFLYHKPFWTDDPFLIIYNWSLALVVLVLGVFIFKKLRPYFADVL